MREFQGNARHEGKAMAVGVIVDVQHGMSALPQRILREGLKALRTNLPESERPEVVVVSDTLAIASTVRLPGVQVVAIVTEGDDAPVFPLSVPTVSSVPGVIKSLSEEDIVIVDADSGVVIVDPDVHTVIEYQNALAAQPEIRIFLEGSHLPAKTLDGRTVAVAAVVSSLTDAEEAISEGADELIVRFSQVMETDTSHRRIEPDVETLEILSAMAVGKHMVVLVADPSERLLNVAGWLTSNGGITFASPDEAPLVTGVGNIADAVEGGAARVVVRPSDIEAAKDIIRTIGALEGVDGESRAG